MQQNEKNVRGRSVHFRRIDCRKSERSPVAIKHSCIAYVARGSTLAAVFLNRVLAGLVSLPIRRITPPQTHTHSHTHTHTHTHTLTHHTHIPHQTPRAHHTPTPTPTHPQKQSKPKQDRPCHRLLLHPKFVRAFLFAIELTEYGLRMLVKAIVRTQPNLR